MRRGILALFAVLASASQAAGQCELGQVFASDAATSANFGHTSALGPGRALIGAPTAGGRGQVYVFERASVDPFGWSEVALLAPTLASTRFGAAVALDGDRALVGAPHESVSAPFSGAAYLFERTAAGWVQVAMLAPVAAEEGRCGSWLDLSGDVAILGSNIVDGRAHVFERDGTGTWVAVQALTTSDGGPVAGSVAVDGNLAVCGASFDDTLGFEHGAAYVFERAPAGGWTESAKLLPADPGGGDLFGLAVSLSGDAVLVGSHRDDHEGGGSAGSAYVFERGVSGWTQTAKLVASDASAGDHFGVSVSLSGDTALVGAYTADTEVAPFSGLAYVFRRSGAGWMQTRRLVPAEVGHNDHLGWSVAVSGDTALAGALLADENGFGAGAGYLFSIPDFATPLCACSSDAPCGNGGHAGCVNSTDRSATLRACGSNSVAADDLTLAAENLPPGHFGLMFMSRGQVRRPLGDGLLCAAGASIHRLPIRFTGAEGRIEEGPGIVAFSEFLFGSSGHIRPGDTWTFQTWFRDADGPCGAGFNSSSALAVSFAP